MKASRPIRVNRIARKLALRAERRADPKRLRPLRRRERQVRAVPIVAYDLETTRIRAGETPRPLYLTAFGASWQASVAVASIAQLRDVIAARLLTEENNRVRFVAWNGNHFDVYLVAQALLSAPEYLIRPYLTRSKNLRGLRVIARGQKDKRGRALSWEFLDGISMTGLQGCTLKKFLATFAPDYAKLAGPDFEREEFNPRNPAHVSYAERDAEGLYRGLMEAERIVRDTFGETLRPTIGNLSVRIFQARMPADATCWAPSWKVRSVLRGQVMRGGYCFRARKWDRGLWKYDLNQAYVAAMREAKLPGGSCRHVSFGLNPYARVYIARLTATNARNTVPFYCRDLEGKALYALAELPETWLTSIEVEQLQREGWKLDIKESYFWQEPFSMKKFVDELETLRANAPGGPSGAQGTMVKMLGNNSYGKTVEQLDGLELVMALDCPEGFSQYQGEADELQYIWYRFGVPQAREYHQPQLGCFITAHVRMVVRRAILKAPDAWLYADTDCVAFTRPVELDLHPSRYGVWKCEEAGTEFYVIGKKVYASKDGRVMHAKGMNVRRLNLEDFRAWFNGRPPEQVQVQRQNFVKFVTGGAMFREHKKVGEKIPVVKTA